MRIVPRTRWGLIRMIALAGILPLLFLIIWLWTVRMPGPTFTGRLPPLTPNQDAMRLTLERHVRTLAHDIGVRSDERYANVQRAAAYIERNLQALGYQVVSLEFTARNRRYRNLEATLRGTSRPQEVIVLGAHYDTAKEAPGADDNASGVAGGAAAPRGVGGGRPARTGAVLVFSHQ